MTEFVLDQRLLNDCSLLKQTEHVSYLLHHNAEVMWLILVPHTLETEFYRLKAELQNRLCTEINRVSDFIQSTFSIDKINVATIGNVVSQLHIHIIGRRMNDAYWPDVVWGKSFEKKHDSMQVADIAQQLSAFLDES